MKIYDISQEVFSCAVYPGDPAPQRQTLCATDAGDLYNLTAFSMCAHNGTHVDAPYHFLPEGKTVEAMDADERIPEKMFAIGGRLSDILKRVKEAFAQVGVDEEEAEWIFSLKLGIPKSAIAAGEERILKRAQVEEILKVA